MGPLCERGEQAAAKGMKGVKRDERDGGREKRAGRQKREKETPKKRSIVLLRTLNCIYSPNYVHLTY